MEHPARPLVIARGGASAEAPEHTIAAFEVALDEAEGDRRTNATGWR